MTTKQSKVITCRERIKPLLPLDKLINSYIYFHKTSGYWTWQGADFKDWERKHPSSHPVLRDVLILETEIIVLSKR